jgi:hypothetical protein
MTTSAAAADLIAQGRRLYCVPSSCIAALPEPSGGPLNKPASYYPWSVLWRAADDSGRVRAVVNCAEAMSRRLGWLGAGRPEGAIARGQQRRRDSGAAGFPPPPRRPDAGTGSVLILVNGALAGVGGVFVGMHSVLVTVIAAIVAVVLATMVVAFRR